MKKAKIIQGWGSARFWRLQNKGCQMECIAKSVVALKSGWTGKGRAQGRLREGEKGKRPQAGSSEGWRTGPRGGGTETL